MFRKVRTGAHSAQKFAGKFIRTWQSSPSSKRGTQVNPFDVLDAAQVAWQVEGPLAAEEVGFAFADELDNDPR